MIKKNTICLWDGHDAEEAARFYAQTFLDSTVDGEVHAATGPLHLGYMIAGCCSRKRSP